MFVFENERLNFYFQLEGPVPKLDGQLKKCSRWEGDLI